MKTRLITFTFFIFYGYIKNPQCDRLHDGLIAQLVDHCIGVAEVIGNAFQTKMWHSNLEKFRRALIFDADKRGVSKGFG